MVQIKLAGSRKKKPRGGSGTVNIPVKAARGVAVRRKYLHSIPVTPVRPSVGGSGADGVELRSGPNSSGAGEGCSGAIETLIWGAPQPGQNARRSSRGCPQR